VRIVARSPFIETGSSASRPRIALWCLLFSRQPSERVVVDNQAVESSQNSSAWPTFDPMDCPEGGRSAGPDHGQVSSRRVLYRIRISVRDFSSSRKRTYRLRRNLAPPHRPVGYRRIRTRLRNSTALPLLHLWR